MTSPAIARELVDAALALLAPRLVLLVPDGASLIAAAAGGRVAFRWPTDEAAARELADVLRPGDRLYVISEPGEVHEARAVALELACALGRRVRVVELDEPASPYLRSRPCVTAEVPV